jgi:glucosamine 6-phosphate synthetase-like amidotransferase/phosphosugar isomerase protein
MSRPSHPPHRPHVGDAADGWAFGFLTSVSADLELMVGLIATARRRPVACLGHFKLVVTDLGQNSAEMLVLDDGRLQHLPDLIGRALDLEGVCASIANRYYHADIMLYLGRGIYYPIALEGVLKMKEITYLHAEGYAAGELKHGPIALIDSTCPVLAVAPSDELFERFRQVSRQPTRCSGSSPSMKR